MEALLHGVNPTIQLLIIMAMFSLLPFAFACMTSFLRYVIVFSILKTSLGTTQVPPSMVVIGFSLLLTIYTMMPVFNQMHQAAYPTYQRTSSLTMAVQKGVVPLKTHMLKHTHQSDIAFFLELGKKELPESPDELSMTTVIPAYILSEMKTAFTIGFVIFMPFVIIDILVANLLLALGIFMLSPTVIAIPFKVLIFVGVDGWSLIVNGLVNSFN